MLSLNNVNIAFGSLKILDGFSTTFGSNEFTCLFGPSGVGKSTILNLLAGILKPDSGEILNPFTKIGYVFQEPRLLPWCTAWENIEIGLYATELTKSQRKDIIAPMIEKLGLNGFADYYPAQLSGGMKQRVGLGRAFVVDPQLLLMDEPFSGLDEALKLEMRNLLHELIEWHPCTTIFVTHDFLEALCLADQIVLLDKKPSSRPNFIRLDNDKRDDPDYIKAMESELLGGVVQSKPGLNK